MCSVVYACMGSAGSFVKDATRLRALQKTMTDLDVYYTRNVESAGFDTV